MNKYRQFYLGKKAEASVKSKERIAEKQIKSDERILLKELKAKRDIEAKRLKAYAVSREKRFSNLKKLEPMYISQEQEMLGDLFGANPDNKVLFGSSEDSLPRMNGILFTGEGLIKNGDVERRTGSFFGI